MITLNGRMCDKSKFRDSKSGIFMTGCAQLALSDGMSFGHRSIGWLVFHVVTAYRRFCASNSMRDDFERHVELISGVRQAH
eukprot:912939-Pleurochrysis_carterae.AAC.1